VRKSYEVRVFNKDNLLLGYCSVLIGHMPGMTYVVATAHEGDEVCPTCGSKHVDFRDIIYDICLNGQGELGLKVRNPEDARHLPGFKSS